VTALTSRLPQPHPFTVRVERIRPRGQQGSHPERGIRGAPRSTDGEPLRCCRMAEEEQVDETWRLEVREVAASELQVGAGERRWLLRELERAAVGGTLEAAREPRPRSQGRELQREEQQQGLRQAG